MVQKNGMPINIILNAPPPQKKEKKNLMNLGKGVSEGLTLHQP